jgi:hypothetical protein
VSVKKLGLIAAGAIAAGGLALGTAAIADAATPTPSPSASSGPEGGRGGADDTPVTGDEAAKVTAAVKAKDSAVTVTTVRKDPDGSYDALGTKAGNPVMFDVSTDLKTITQATGHGGPGGHGGSPAPSAGTPS